MAFTQSMYRHIGRCEKYVWLDAHRRDLRGDAAGSGADDAVLALAKGFFGPYVDASVLRDGVRDHRASVERTREYLDREEQTVCGAAFDFEGLSCTVDILHRENGGYVIYMLKVASNVAANEGAHYAYQQYILEHCGVRVTGVQILSLSRDYIRGTELDASRLFQKHDRTDLVRRELASFGEKLAHAEAVLAGPEPVCDIARERECFKDDGCPYLSCCTAHLPRPSVFDLYQISGKKWTLYEAGKTDFRDLLGEDLKPIQKRQVEYGVYDRGDYVDREGVRAFLDTLFYPMHFFDFESMQLPVPLYPGTRPYSQIPFQYSLHHIDEPGGELKHTEFLDISGQDPRRAIAERIVRDIPQNACVIVYHKHYEAGRLKELADLFPDLREHLLKLVENLRDLKDPFSGGCYYNRAMGGSFSIKSVLPALFPDDPELSYSGLEGIHKGTDVVAVFPKIRDMTPEEQERIRASLLAYCKLDTLAMVKIWQKIREAVEDDR